MSSNDGVVPRREKSVTMFMAESYIGHKLCWPGDLVINSLWAWATGLGFARQHGIVSSAYGVYRPRPDYSVMWRYFDLLLRSKAYDWELHVRSKGIWISRLQLTDDSFLDMPILLPPTDEAEHIVEFLDRADRRINRLIRAKRRLIELLNEQKQAIIHHAVTRGLDPNVRLKPSGVEAIGDVPEEWEVRRLKFAARLHRGYDLPDPLRRPGDVPVVSSGGIIGTHDEARVSAPGVVTGRYGSTGALYYVENDFWPHNTALYVSDFHGNNPRFVFYLLHTLAFGAHSGKSAVPGIDRKDLHDIPVPAPPADEQQGIAQRLDLDLGDSNTAILSARRSIELLREYRTRLIADVVTGKLDVRGIDLPPLDEDAALDEIDAAEEGDAEDPIDEELSGGDA